MVLTGEKQSRTEVESKAKCHGHVHGASSAALASTGAIFLPMGVSFCTRGMAGCAAPAS